MLAAAQFTVCDLSDPIVSGTAPSSPAKDTLWLDTSVTPHVLKRWNGSTWVKCSADVDLSNYYTKTEMNTQLTQTQQLISSKADAATVSSLGARVAAAEEKVTPQAISQTVISSALYAFDNYAGRNYALGTNETITFIDNALQLNGVSGGFETRLSLSDDLLANSGNGASIRFSFDIKRTGIDASATSSGITYFGVTVYYKYTKADGAITTSGRGWALVTTQATFNANDSDWVRLYYGPMNISADSPVSFEYFTFGSALANGMTGTVQVRNLKVETGSAHTEWCLAPEDLYGLSGRLSNAESSILQQSNQLALKVNTSTYNADKVYRSATAPTTLYLNMLWLDISVTPNLLKRYTTSGWVVVGAEEVKTSGVYIGPNQVSISTENFLLQLLDPANNEKVLMEMSANGEVGFTRLYADKIISSSVASAYDGPEYIDIDPSFTGTSDSIFRSLGDAVKAVNNKFLPYDVYIFLPYDAELYEPEGTHITGISGSGSLTIYGGGGGIYLNSYITIKGCTAEIRLNSLDMREIRPLSGSNRNPYLIELYMDRLVYFDYCTLDANSTTYDSIFCKLSYAVVTNTALYNAVQGLEVYMGWAFMQACRGSCSWSMVSYGGYIIATGTVPSGSRSTGYNGQLYATGVTVNYGTATSPVTPQQTNTFYATTTKSYKGGWRTDTLDVIQGVYSSSGYSSSLSWHRGCMWFSTLASTLSGKTIKSATLTIYREAGAGSGSEKSVYLCAISNTSASGTPSILVNYGSIGVIGRDEQLTFSIPVDAVQGLADGSYGGLCLYETPYNFKTSTYSSCYMRIGGMDSDYPPYLTVVYS